MTEQERNIKSLTGQIERLERQISKLEKDEAAAKKHWTRGYQQNKKNIDTALSLKRRDTQKYKKLRFRIDNWNNILDRKYTRQRDEAREKQDELKLKLSNLRQEIKVISSQWEMVQKKNDEMVDTLFSLVAGRKNAEQALNNYAEINIYPNARNADGTLKRGRAYEHSEGTRKFRVGVNTITSIDATLAQQALDLISSFLTKASAIKDSNDENLMMFTKLTRLILVESKKFKIGPNFDKFITMNIDGEKFPELKEAQELLKQGIRSEQSTPYIRLYEKINRDAKWQEVKQR